MPPTNAGSDHTAVGPARHRTWTLPLFLGIVFIAAAANFWRLPLYMDGAPTTIQHHLDFAAAMAEGKITVFHGMFFQVINMIHAVGVSRETAATGFMALCVAVVALQTYLYLSRRLTGLYSSHALCGIVALTLLVNAIYIPYLTRGVYLGQWGPNLYHNATVTTVKVFSLPVFVLLASLLSQGSRRNFSGDLVLASALLCVSLYAKPTLFLMMGPGAMLYALCVRSSWRSRIITLAVVLSPAVIYLAYQRYLAYGVPTSPFRGRSTDIAPFWVWSQWTNSIPLSIACTLAFPAAVTYLTWRERRRDDEFSFAWILMFVGFLQGALLVEVQGRAGYLWTANWFGVYLLATHLLFIVATAEFFGWYARAASGERHRPATRFAMVLLALHTFSGLVYLVRLSYVRSAYA